MTTREQLLTYVEEWKKANPKSEDPIFLIYALDNPDGHVTYQVPWLGYPVTFPSPGTVEDESFYEIFHDLDKAIEFLNQNQMAVQDGCFFGAFILLKIPGIPPFNTTDTRMFFRWDEDKDGFFQQEEPKIFKNLPVYPMW